MCLSSPVGDVDSRTRSPLQWRVRVSGLHYSNSAGERLCASSVFAPRLAI